MRCVQAIIGWRSHVSAWRREKGESQILNIQELKVIVTPEENNKYESCKTDSYWYPVAGKKRIAKVFIYVSLLPAKTNECLILVLTTLSPLISHRIVTLTVLARDIVCRVYLIGNWPSVSVYNMVAP